MKYTLLKIHFIGRRRTGCVRHCYGKANRDDDEKYKIHRRRRIEQVYYFIIILFRINELHLGIARCILADVMANACWGSAERVDYMWPEVAGVFTFNRDGGFRYGRKSAGEKRSSHQRETGVFPQNRLGKTVAQTPRKIVAAVVQPTVIHNIPILILHL